MKNKQFSRICDGHILRDANGRNYHVVRTGADQVVAQLTTILGSSSKFVVKRGRSYESATLFNLKLGDQVLVGDNNFPSLVISAGWPLRYVVVADVQVLMNLDGWTHIIPQ